MQHAASVLVVDDSSLMRRMIQDMFAVSREFVVVGTARNGRAALEQITALNPDIVTLDVEMPELDGLQTLERIMRDTPRPVVMLSGATTPRGHDLTVRALELGAVDFVRKPSGPISLDLGDVTERLLTALRAAREANLRGLEPRPPRPAVESSATPVGPGRGGAARVIGIATSTGGPRALAEVVPNLPHDLDAAVLIVQHMPSGFTRSLAQRLDAISALTVAEAEDGETVVAGRVYLAPGGRHMRVSAATTGPRVTLRDDAPVWGVRPAADPLFRSLAEVYREACVCAVLTGMGRDGADGLQAVRAAGGRGVVQDRESATIYGMPQAARPFADRVVSLEAMAHTLTTLLLRPVA
jgi:two-component system, chemotaxis family, protein-glutamate methylesterase/glutaminase